MNPELEKELSMFLDPSTKQELKTIAVENVLGLTGSTDGKEFLGNSETLLGGLISLTSDERTDIQEMAYKSLINIATIDKLTWNILNVKKFPKQFVNWLELVLDPTFKMADLVCKLLSNVTRYEKSARQAAEETLAAESVGIEKIVMALCNMMYNEHADLHYLGALLSNLSQSREVREKILDKEQLIIQRLLPFTEFKQSAIRRAGIIGTLKNCCFETEYHEWLLGDQVDLLPRLLLPLAGPEEFDDEDNDKLPDDLQYLPPDKQREPEPSIRKTICEALLQLCATKKGKKFVKDKNTYVIMREYYAWERKKEPVNEIAAMNLIDILIGDEPTDEFADNLKEVEIPNDVQEKFFEDDRKELESALQEKLEIIDKEKEELIGKDKLELTDRERLHQLEVERKHLLENHKLGEKVEK